MGHTFDSAGDKHIAIACHYCLSSAMDCRHAGSTLAIYSLSSYPERQTSHNCDVPGDIHRLLAGLGSAAQNNILYLRRVNLCSVKELSDYDDAELIGTDLLEPPFLGVRPRYGSPHRIYYYRLSHPVFPISVPVQIWLLANLF
jgi:hypothetical protein